MQILSAFPHLDNLRLENLRIPRPRHRAGRIRCSLPLTNLWLHNVAETLSDGKQCHPMSLLASLLAAGFEPETLVQFAACAALGGGVGAAIGRRIGAVELPQMVAALHSVVGLAAVFTSIASVLGHPEDTSALHLVTAYLGVLIGECTSSRGSTQRAIDL